MSETNETADKTLRGGPRKPLSLKRTVESGHVRQSFSHGRSKSVVVEKKKKRTIAGSGEPEEKVLEAPEAPVAERMLAEVIQARPPVGGLSSDELDARQRALRLERERAETETKERARLGELAPPTKGCRAMVDKFAKGSVARSYRDGVGKLAEAG